MEHPQGLDSLFRCDTGFPGEGSTGVRKPGHFRGVDLNFQTVSLVSVSQGSRKTLRRAAGSEWNALPTAGWLPPGAAPGVRKPRVLPGGDGEWVLCAAPSYFCVAIFLHFVSFQIFVPGNTLTPLINFFPTEI